MKHAMILGRLGILVVLAASLAANLPAVVAKTETVSRGGRELVLESGTIAVPENRSRPASRSIILPWQRIKALDPTTGRPPLFLLNGGPGSSNFNDAILPPVLWGTRDVVLIGYRGVDGPSVLDSAAFNQAVWGIDAQLSEAALRRIALAFGDFVRRSRAAGIDTDGYTARQVAADIEALRLDLGYGVIDLYGVSYGTRLAYLYARDFPATVRRMVMLGGNGPGMFMVAPTDIAEVVGRYEAAWQADLAGPLARVSRDMPEHWLWWPIDRGAVKLGAQLLLANTGMAPAVFAAYARADRGDASALVGISLLAPLFTSRMNMADLFLKGIVDRQAERAVLTETADPALIGRAFLRGTFGAIAYLDADLVPARPADDEPLDPKPVQAATLIVNGSFDASTPLRAVRENLMPLLPQGHLAVLEGYGHDEIISLQPDFLGDAMLWHLDGAPAEPPPLPARVPPQEPSLDFALVAWVATGAVALVPLLLAGIIVLVVRRKRRRARA